MRLMAVLSVTALLSVNLRASEHPDAFTHFFAQTPKPITVVLAGETTGQEVIAQVNFDQFRIDPESRAYTEMSNFLTRSQLNGATVSMIMGDAVTGIETNAACSVRLSQCVLAMSPDSQPQYVYDFDEALLKIFVPASSLRDVVTDIEYESAYNAENGLINWTNLYGFSDFDGHDSITWSNETYLGLAYGQLYFDTTYSSSRQDFTTYVGQYDAHWHNWRLQAGYSRYTPTFNTTDYLNNGIRLAGERVFVGHSRNLIRGNVADLQRINFYAPQAGQLEIYRNERLILNRVVNEGGQYVSYADLPRGAYQITLILRVGGEVVLTETRQVVNNNQFALQQGQVDIVAGIGRLDKPRLEEFDQGVPREFGRVLLNTRWSDTIMVGAGLMANSDSTYVQAGIGYNYSHWLSATYVGGRFTDDEWYQTSRLGLGRFYVDWQATDVDSQGRRMTLAQALYGTTNRREWGGGYSDALLGGQLFIRYDRARSQYHNSIQREHRDMVSTGWSVPFFGGQLNLTADYDWYERGPDESRFGLSWTRDLGQGVSVQMTTYTNQEGFESNTNYVRAQHDSDNWQLTGAVGARLEQAQPMGGEINVAAYGGNEHLRVSSYGFADERGRQNASLSLSGSQVLTPSYAMTTRERGASFVHVARDYAGDFEQTQPTLKLQMVRDGRYGFRGDLDSDEVLMPVPTYEFIQLDVDEMGSLLDVDNRHFNQFTHPGGVYNFAMTLSPLAYMVVVLDDVFDAPVSAVQCVGDDCVNVDTLSEDGVFGIRYREGGRFRLVSNKGLCLFEAMGEQGYYNGYCLPGLNATGDMDWEELPEAFDSEATWRDSKDTLLFYLGRFEHEGDAQAVMAQLDELDIRYKPIRVAGEVFVYIVEQQTFTQAQRALLESLDTYVLLKDAELDLLTIQSSGENNKEGV
ncbi:TcfC E-set like domain-containing protein [Vibrio sp. WXL103]|uniref:TcfC E-set like domain-containing protein n=1 Tax=Vibrio sp. WXL103 TaxID=3450710 RepID=UPI003EC94AEE